VLCVLLTCGGLTALVAQVATGSSGDPLTYTSAKQFVPNQDIGRTQDSVGCPGSDSHPTGGGVEIRGDQTDLNLEVAGSASSQRHSGWFASVNNNSGSPAHMTTTVICAKGKFVYESAARTIKGNNQAQKEVSCPAGTKVTGGGINTGSILPQVEVSSSEPVDDSDPGSEPDNGWLGIANNGRPGSVGMTVEAVCAKSGSFKYVQTPPASVADGGQISNVASCPKGSQVTGGGVDITGIDDGIEVAGTFPSDGGDQGFTPDDGWEGVANNDATGSPERMQVFAICLK
jgi:hypothetical protein